MAFAVVEPTTFVFTMETEHNSHFANEKTMRSAGKRIERIHRKTRTPASKARRKMLSERARQRRCGNNTWPDLVLELVNGGPKIKVLTNNVTGHTIKDINPMWLLVTLMAAIWHLAFPSVLWIAGENRASDKASQQSSEFFVTLGVALILVPTFVIGSYSSVLTFMLSVDKQFAEKTEITQEYDLQGINELTQLAQPTSDFPRTYRKYVRSEAEASR